MILYYKYELGYMLFNVDLQGYEPTRLILQGYEPTRLILKFQEKMYCPLHIELVH
jgi:hypothetical protein